MSKFFKIGDRVRWIRALAKPLTGNIVAVRSSGLHPIVVQVSNGDKYVFRRYGELRLINKTKNFNR
jgi:hypothetical protein